MNILVPNLGTTSIKYQILAMPAEVAIARGKVERVSDYGEAVARLETGGVAIQLEIWRMPVEKIGQFLELVPPPMCIGNVELQDKSWVKGFLCEPAALQNGRDISSYGGWRDYLIDTRQPAGYKP